MDLLSYLIPLEPFAVVIVALQMILFIVWIIKLLGVWLRHGRIWGQISKPVFDSDEGSDEGIFSDQFNKGSLSAFSEIENHISTIQLAGKRNSHLDITLLIKNTIDQLNKNALFLRSLLSLFIILGLLGTLGGLAMSLSELSSIPLTGSTAMDDALAKGLKELLKKLGGAFAPSIWGVGFTVIGVFLFSIYQRSISIPLGNLIEYKTLSEWGPLWLKTSEQGQKEKLEKLQELIEETSVQSREGNEAVKDFKEAAKKLNSDAGDLAVNVATAGETLNVLNESSRNLKEFSEKFVESVSHLTSFQGELKSIYEKVKSNSQELKESVNSALAENKDFQGKVSSYFETQGEETKEILNAFKLYEEGYLQSRENIDKDLQNLLITATNTYEKIASQNEEIIKGLAAEVGTPLQGKLSEELRGISEKISKSLKEVSKDISGELASVTTKFGEFNDGYKGFTEKLETVKASIDSVANPMKESATDIKGIATGFDTRTKTFLTDLNSEFETQNTTTQSQLENLEGLKESVGNLSGQFDGLGQKIDSFNSRVGTFEKASNKFADKLSAVDGRNRARTTPPDDFRPKLPETRWQKVKSILGRK